MDRQLDVLFVNPGAAHEIYQQLSVDLAAIETPTWSLLLAESCRKKGFGVDILDINAEKLTHTDAYNRIKEINPRLVCFVVYGQNPNSGTTNMAGVVPLAKLLEDSPYKVAVIGSHASALPLEVLQLPGVDFVVMNEGVLSLHNLLATNLDDVDKTGFCYKKDGLPILRAPQNIVHQNQLDDILPKYSFDLLSSFNNYRSCNWHADFNEKHRSPFAAIYTSLGCSFRCEFCMISILNRVNVDDNTTSADSNIMRWWNPNNVITWFDELVGRGVTTIRVSDEMFLLNKKYYVPLLELLSQRDYAEQLRLWVYSRVDSVNEKYLDLLRKAGIRWIALGIESANTTIRREITKGSFKDTDIREVVKEIRNHDINVIANYLYGTPEDSQETMQQTADLACELNTEMMNCYAVQALPGSPLYLEAKNNGWELPKGFADWSFHSYGTLPLPTKHLKPEEVLRFRDEAWYKYFVRPEYLGMIEKRFGIHAKEHIINMTKIKLKRKLLGDSA